MLTCLSSALFCIKANAEDNITLPSDCYYSDEELLNNGNKICYYECDSGAKEITVKATSECPDPE